MYGDGRETPYQAVEEMFRLVDDKLRMRKIQFQPFAPLRHLIRRSPPASVAGSALPTNPRLKHELKA